MLRFKIFSFVFIIILLLYTSCTSVDDPAKKELKWYLNVVLVPFNLEAEAIDALAAVSGDNYQTDQAMLEAIRSRVLPKLREFKKAMKAIEPVTNEVSGLNRQYLEVIDLHIKAVETLEVALMKGSKTELEEWKRLLSQRSLVYNKWEVKLTELNKKYK
ncbi:MAG: hypothetical protein HQM16_15480 [Deltaproteobacteria bacterium]|nr:hypothetical protein [Deltaproteobacteria bacterium]